MITTLLFQTFQDLHPYQNEYGGGYSQAWDQFAYNPATDPASWAAFNGQNIPYYAADESWGPKIRWYFSKTLGFMDSWSPRTLEQLRAWSPNPNNVKNFFETGIANLLQVLSFAKGGEDFSVRATGRVTSINALPSS